MTAKEAIEKGIRLVRLPNWDSWSYLELPKKDSSGLHGLWAYLYDPISAAVLQDHRDNFPFPFPVLSMEWDNDDDQWIEYVGNRFTPDDIRQNKHIAPPPTRFSPQSGPERTTGPQWETTGLSEGPGR